jgi:hypothetical protein
VDSKGNWHSHEAALRTRGVVVHVAARVSGSVHAVGGTPVECEKVGAQAGD